MSRDYLLDVLEKFAQVTSIIVETSKIKEDLDNKSVNDENLTEILERIKSQVDNLFEHATSVKNLFYKKYESVAKKLKTVNGKDVNENTSKESDSSVCDSNKTEDEVASKTEKSPKKPIIKMVDINKLLEPRALIKQEPQKPVKHIHFDDTVVIITSSDEETPLAKTKTAPLRTTSKRKVAQETIKKARLALQMHSSSNSESSDDEVLPAKSNRIKNGRQKKELEKVQLDASSNLSDNSSDNDSIKNKKKQKSKENDTEIVDKDTEPNISEMEWKKDAKFNLQCYVKVIRVPCEKLKEYYLEKLELLEINKLRDITSLQKKRRRSSSENSSGSDDGKSRRKSVAQTAKCSDSDETEDLLEDKTDATPSNLDLDVTPDLPNDKSVEEMAEDALNMLNSDQEDANETPEEEEHPEPVNKNVEELKSAEEDVPSNSKDVMEDKDENISSNVEKQSEKDTEEIEKDNSGEKNNQSEKEKTMSDQSSKSETGNVNSEKEKSDNDDNISSNEDTEKNKDKDKSKKAWRKDKLLRMKLSSSDSEEEFEKFCKKKEKMQEEVVSDDEPKLPADKKKRKIKKRMKKRILSDSDSDGKKDSADDFQPESSSSSSESEKENEKEEESDKPKPRKRVKRVRDSSEDDDEKSTRKQIRNIWGRDSLAETTKQAEAEEKERKARIAEKQKKYNQVYEGSSTQNAKVEKVVLDFDDKSKEELLRVDDSIVSKLKPHQASGLQFMWDACFESLERAKDTKGSGCILAHCMGLGKTLQVIALSHTLLVNSEKTNVKKVLVVSPLNTVLNWVNEFKMWLPDEDDFDIYELVSFKQNYERQYQVNTWHKNGGVLIMGYDMFRNLSNPDNKRLSKKMRSVFQEALVDPGPDLVICDEGHLLKNEKTNLSIAMNRIRTLRRIVLTGTPLQNNLKEYFCMVQFIKPNLLGTYKEYLNRFVNPIINGQYTDSTPHDIQIMRKRSHVLHKMLDGVVQRRDYSVLEPYLPPKFEYVIFLKLSETQIKLYQHYMDHFARRSTDGSNRTSFLFVDFQALQRICTHPRVLLDKSIEMKLAKEKREEDEESEGSLKDFINDDDEDETSASSNSSSEDEKEEGGEKNAARKRVTRAAAALAKENGESEDPIVIEEDNVEKEWWQEYCDGKELDVIAHSSKLFLLFEILKECEQIGDKVLVFSQSLYSLNVIEYFIGKIHDATQAGETESVGGYSGSWCLGLDYFRLDGSSSCDNRNTWCKTFNDPSNTRARLFLISTRAGGLGINLVAANRVIIFDVSWNPSHDVQSIYRVYRFGQTKPSYIYRFVTQGTMEMKIYERQVTKQAISKRVIDEQQIDRHYNQNDLAELYKFEPDPGERPIPLVPKDVLLGELLQKFEDRIYKYHEHQSLLENKEDEVLNEEERKAAWEEFENEKKQRNTWGNAYMRTNNIELALASIIRKENPSWTEVQIKSLIPSLNAQLQEQVAKGDLSLYRRVQRELQIIQTLQAQRLREQFYQQQLLQRMQQQQQQQFADRQLSAQLADAMKYRNAESWLNHYMNPDQMPGTSHAQAAAALNPSDIIDLND